MYNAPENLEGRQTKFFYSSYVLPSRLHAALCASIMPNVMR